MNDETVNRLLPYARRELDLQTNVLDSRPSSALEYCLLETLPMSSRYKAKNWTTDPQGH